MKRADIKAGPVYGYYEGTSHIWRYDPVVVLSTDLYMIDRYSHVLTRADEYHKTMTTGRSSYGNAVGMLVVFPSFGLDDPAYDASMARLRELATAEAAVEGINGDGRAVTDGINAQTGEAVVLGRYGLLTNQRYLHGDYFELTAELEANRRRSVEQRDAKEADRVTRLGTYNALADRLDALGITGYHAADWENKSRFEGLTFEDMDALLDLAEAGHAHEVATNGMMH